MDSPKSINRFMFLYLLWEMLPMQIILIIPALLINKLSPNMEDSVYYVNMFIVQDFFLVLLPILLCMSIFRDRLSELISLHGLSLWNIIFIVMIGFLMDPVMEFISAVTSLMCPDTNMEVEMAMMQTPLPIGLLVMGILPAIFEETLFRGFVFGAAKRFSVKKSMLLSAFYFGLFHLNGYQIPYAMFAGLILALVTYATGTILAPILLHLVINGSQVISVYIYLNSVSDAAAQTADTALTGDYILTLCVSALIFGVLLALMLRAFVRYNKKHNKYCEITAPLQSEQPYGENKPKFADRYFLLNIALFVLYMIITHLLSKNFPA